MNAKYSKYVEKNLINVMKCIFTKLMESMKRQVKDLPKMENILSGIFARNVKPSGWRKNHAFVF